MSLRIKLPAKVVDDDSPPQHAEPTSARRKTTKRRVLVDSDEDDDIEVDPSEATHDLPRSRPSYKRSRASESDLDLDIDIEGGNDSAESRFLSHSPPRASYSSNSHLKQPKAGSVDGPPTKKKRSTVVWSDDEDEDAEFDYNQLTDDDFTHEQKRSGKQKVVGKVKAGKSVGGGSKGAKGKGGKELKEIMMKDERKVPPVRPTSGVQEVTGTKRPRPKELPRIDDANVDVVGGSASTPEPTATAVTEGSPPAKDDTQPPPPKKRKLPTIKKNKAMGSAGPATPSSSSAPPKPPASVAVAKAGAEESSKLPPQIAGARKPAATVGNADFDLRKPSVYAELFKTAGGSTPRSGLNRREKDEERRKELNKMRDEAKMKRSLEAKHTFDLQGQLDKIARFEERLRRERSSAVYPNCLGAKWREEWEKERKRNRERGL